MRAHRYAVEVYAFNWVRLVVVNRSGRPGLELARKVLGVVRDPRSHYSHYRIVAENRPEREVVS